MQGSSYCQRMRESKVAEEQREILQSLVDAVTSDFYKMIRTYNLDDLPPVLAILSSHIAFLKAEYDDDAKAFMDRIESSIRRIQIIK